MVFAKYMFGNVTPAEGWRATHKRHVLYARLRSLAHLSSALLRSHVWLVRIVQGTRDEHVLGGDRRSLEPAEQKHLACSWLLWLDSCLLWVATRLNWRAPLEHEDRSGGVCPVAARVD